MVPTYPGDLLNEIGILCTHVFRITTEDSKLSVLQKMNLGSFSVIFVLASELLSFEAIEHFSDSLGWLGQHWLEWNACRVRNATLFLTRCQLAVLTQMMHSPLHQCWDDQFIVRQFADISEGRDIAHL